MKYQLQGKIHALLSERCRRPIVRGTIRAYRPDPDRDIPALVAADPKRTYEVLTPEQVAKKESRLIAVGHTDERGQYSLTIDQNKTKYEGGPIQIDLQLERIYGAPETPQKSPIQVSLTTLQPDWKTASDDEAVAHWSHDLANKMYCAILAHFDLWVICGRLETCEGHAPIALATVTAFDRDWTQDDNIGSASTDNNGEFLIYYRTQDFESTPFSPLINVEWQHGPDLYFRAELAGASILEESRTVAFQTPRKNVPRCFNVTLCSSRINPPLDNPHWELIEDFDLDAELDSDGYIASGRQVFTNFIRLRGNMPLVNPANSKALKYRFLIGAYKWPGAEDPTVLPSIPPSDAELSPIPADKIRGLVGMLYYYDTDGSEKATKVELAASDVDGDGCIQLLGKSVSVTMSDGTIQDIAISTTNYKDYDLLLEFDARYLEPVGTNTNTATSVATPGTAVPPAERTPIRRYKMAFQVFDFDEAVNKTDADKILPAVVIDSSAIKIGMMLTELESNLCQPITNAVHIKFTVDHPHLDTYSVKITKNAGVVHNAPPLPTNTFAGNIFFRGGQSGAAGANVDVSADEPCAYKVILAYHSRHYDSSRGAGHHVELLYAK